MPPDANELPTVESLDDLARLIDGRPDLYLRWSAGPQADLGCASRDELTGVELPGLSASALAVEPWWSDHPLRLWAARRLYDYEHLQRRRPGARPWVLTGEECGRGPDNEPLIRRPSPVAWVSRRVVEEARATVDGIAGEWGPLDRVSDD